VLFLGGHVGCAKHSPLRCRPLQDLADLCGLRAGEAEVLAHARHAAIEAPRPPLRAQLVEAALLCGREHLAHPAAGLAAQRALGGSRLRRATVQFAKLLSGGLANRSDLCALGVREVELIEELARPLAASVSTAPAVRFVEGSPAFDARDVALGRRL